MTKPPWDFDYVPIPSWRDDDDGDGRDVVVALSAPCSPAELSRAIEPIAPGVSIEPTFSRPPLFWWRFRSDNGLARADIVDRLSRAGIEARYAASALRPSLLVPPRLRYSPDLRCSARNWTVRRGTPAPDPGSPGRWFLRFESGVAVDRTHFGSGSGTRLAVIDDDAAGIEHLEVEAELLVNLRQAPRNSLHGAIMVALAVGTRRSAADEGFQGVAPYASPRLYCTPKPGEDVVSLALAIVRAVDDGADVVVCANYIEGTTSPMLGDALEFAARFGRRGRGTAVLFPVGREASSPESSTHASLSLALSDPASDPRAFAIAPSGCEGGWFLWRDRKGRLRPFANRGPAVRWLAPGDDVAFPFERSERLFHAESSGASAVAAGVVLLLIAANPTLRLQEIDAILTRTASPVPGSTPGPGPLADRWDIDPVGCDRDGHNAKHGYGRLHASRACLTAVDPVCAALVDIGEESVAFSYLAMRSANQKVRAAYSRVLARWTARALVADRTLFHASKALVRHLRAVAHHPVRQRAHGEGSLIRQVILLIQLVGQSREVPSPSKRVARELQSIQDRLAGWASSGAGADMALYAAFDPLWHKAT